MINKTTLTENKEKYRELCDQEESIQVYIKDWWLDAVCGENNWEVLLSYNKDKTIRGSFTLYQKEKWGLKYITQPEFCQNTGLWIKYHAGIKQDRLPAFEKEVIYDLIDQLEQYAQENKIAFAQFSLDPRYTNWLPFYWRGFNQQTRYTYRIEDLHKKTEEEINQSFNRSKKREINRALKEDCKVYHDLTVEEFYEHHKSSLKERDRIIIYDLDTLNKMYTSAIKHKAGQLLSIVNSSGETLATRFFVQDSMSSYSLIESINQDYKSKGFSTLLIQECIFYTKNKKINCYDFEGSMIESIEDSYRKFGTTQTPYFSLKKIFTKNKILQTLLKIILY